MSSDIIFLITGIYKYLEQEIIMQNEQENVIYIEAEKKYIVNGKVIKESEISADYKKKLDGLAKRQTLLVDKDPLLNESIVNGKKLIL